MTLDTRAPIHVPSGPPPAKHHRLARVLVCLLACLVVLAGAVGGGVLYLEHKVSNQVVTIPHAFSGLTHRPAKPTGGAAAHARNILLIGSDRRSAVPTTGSRARAATWVPGEQRSDTMMLVHIAGDRKNVTVVSIPRDSWVHIPGLGMHKVNAAFSYGGPSLAVHTVEQLTGLRIDHLAVVDWDGFRALTDALGGVTVYVPHTVYDSARHKTWTWGWHRLDGSQALLYVRQRHGLPGGDLDRVKRQQNLLRQLLRKTMASNMWTDPVRGYKILDSLTKNMSIDSRWSVKQIRALAGSMDELRSQNVYFTTAPVSGTGRVGAEDVVFLDRAAGEGLWQALDRDHAPQWFAEHPADRLGRTVD